MFIVSGNKIKKNWKCFLALILIAFTFESVSQNKIDSLRSIIKTSKDTTLFNTLNRLSREYDNAGLFDSALSAANNALTVSTSILKQAKDSIVIRKALKGQAMAYTNIGIAYYYSGNYSEALKYYNISLPLKKKIGDKKGIAITLTTIGLVNSEQGNYPEALRNFFEALKLFEELKDDDGISAAYNNLGMIYYSQENYTEALKYYLLSLDVKKIKGDKYALASAYNNIGGVYERLNKYDEAWSNYTLSLSLFKEINNKEGLGSSYNGLGTLLCDRKDYEGALKYYFLALQTWQELNRQSGISSVLLNIGDAYYKMKKLPEAKSYLIKAEELAKIIGYKNCLKEVYLRLMEIDEMQGNYKEAFTHNKMYILYRDSLNNEETRKRTIQNELTYNYEKKQAVASIEYKKELENQRIVSEEKNRKQTLILLLVGSLLILVSIFAVFIFRSLRITRKQKNIIEEQKTIVETQKSEVEQQKLMLDEHQKEIIDSITYARRIQHSLLPSETYIHRILKRLNT
jgi:tetratricopeptide (TPR) repeat protein